MSINKLKYKDMETIINKVVKVNKWVNLSVIQQSFGYGWEDVSIYDNTDRVNLKGDLKEYRLMGYPTRVINRKVLSNSFVK